MEKQIEYCAICRGDLEAPCVGCGAGCNEGDCHGQTSILCSHSYHKHCIERWLKVRMVCPLCNGVWVENTAEYTLQDRVTLTFLGNEEKVLELALTELPDPVYDLLSKYTLDPRTKRNKRNELPTSKQRLLALTFAEYLTQDELKSMIYPSKAPEPPS